MAYQKPQAMIHQQFETLTAEPADGLRAVIVGPNAILHRYEDSDEKTDTYIGLYNPVDDVIYKYPGRKEGGVVDESYSKLFVDNAMLIYYDSDTDTQFHNKADYENVVESTNFNFTEYDNVDRADALGIRDVQVGDYAEVYTEIGTGDECEPISMLSRIVGFVYHYANGVIDNPDVDGPTSTTAGTAITKRIDNVEVADKFTNVSVSGALDLIKYGIIGFNNSTVSNELRATFDILFSKVSSVNCGSSIQATIIGIESGETRKVVIAKDVAFDLSSIEDSTLALTIPSTNDAEDWDDLEAALEAGKNVRFTVTYKVAYTAIEDSAITKVAGSTYTGGSNDKYVVECTTGGSVASGDVEFSIYTAYGTDSSASKVKLTNDNKANFKVGTKGVAINFGSVATICAGTRVFVTVTGPKVDAVNGIALADDLPTRLQNNTANNGAVPFSLRLIARENIEVPAISTITGDTNWEQEETQFIVKEAIQIGSTDFLTDSGDFIPLKLMGYGNVEDTPYADVSKMYFNYREWTPKHAYDIEFCENVGMLDAIAGPLDPDNPLKWAVYKALTNSDGVSVAYVAVKDPEDLDDWQDALDIIEGRTDVYTIVPLTTDLDKQNLVLTLINNESSAEACRWKTALFNMTLPSARMVVGKSELNDVDPTSIDGKATFGAFVDNPNETDTQFTKFICTSGNAKFVDYNVESGDELRIINNITNEVIARYIVDKVYSNSTLLTMTGPAASVTDAKFEIWHTYTRNEEVDLIRDRAQSFSSRRVGLVWPDLVTEDTVIMPGYYLSAALAGLKSGVPPYRSLTRAVINGFDGLTRSKPRYTETQLDQLASSGVWVCVEDSDGTCMSRHAITTSTLSLFYSEEMMTRNMDSISKQLFNVIDPYIGRTNVDDSTLISIRNDLASHCRSLMAAGQMITFDKLTVKQHDLLLDRVIAYLDCALPFAVNNVELYITAGAYHLNEVTTSAEE